MLTDYHQNSESVRKCSSKPIQTPTTVLTKPSKRLEHQFRMISGTCQGKQSDLEDFSLSAAAVQAGHILSQPWTTATCPPSAKHHLTYCFSSTWYSPSHTDEPASWRLDPVRYIARRPEPRAYRSCTPALGRRRGQIPQALACREKVTATGHGHRP